MSTYQIIGIVAAVVSVVLTQLYVYPFCRKNLMSRFDKDVEEYTQSRVSRGIGKLLSWILVFAVLGFILHIAGVMAYEGILGVKIS